jgi:hypothetical protein
LQVVLDADFLDQFELGFEVVDVFLGVFQDVFQNLARDVIIDAFAIGDRGLGVGVRATFQGEVAGQALGDVLPRTPEVLRQKDFLFFCW